MVAPPGGIDDLISGAMGFIVIETAREPVLPAFLVAFAVKLNVPLCVGVPEITPVDGASDKPGGNEPPEIL